LGSLQQRDPWAWDYKGIRKKKVCCEQKGKIDLCLMIRGGGQRRRSANFTGSVLISMFLVLELMSRGQNRRQECVWKKVRHFLRKIHYFDKHILPLFGITVAI